MRYNRIISLICLGLLAAVSAVAWADGPAATVDRATSPDRARFSNMACIQQVDEIGNFVRMLCVSPDPRRGGRMKYNPPARNETEVWSDLSRQRSDRPFWN